MGKGHHLNHNRELAMTMYCMGFAMLDICTKTGYRFQGLTRLIKREKWDVVRTNVLTEKQLRLTKGAREQQIWIRATEETLGRELLLAGRTALDSVDLTAATVDDCVKLIRLGSELSRLAQAMPLQPIEVNVRHDLGDTIKAALAKAYGTPALSYSRTVSEKAENPAIDVQSINNQDDASVSKLLEETGHKSPK
jgi:hypothetical protein